MGNCCVQVKLIRNRVTFRRRRRKIVLLLVGLNNSGKTSTAKGLVGEKMFDTVPTVGFTTFSLTHKGYSVVIYDLGGGPQIRDIWCQYFVDVHGIIYVIDASDASRIDESRVVLQNLLMNDKLKGKPLLLLANKQDVEGALDEIDVVERLNLELIVNKQKCPTLVETCSAVPLSTHPKLWRAKLDPGIQNGFRWIMGKIIKDFQTINSRVEKDIESAQSELAAEKENRRRRVEEQRRQREEMEGTTIIPLRDSSPDSYNSKVITVHSSTEVTDIARDKDSEEPKAIHLSDSQDSGYNVQTGDGDKDADSLRTIQSRDSAVQSMLTDKYDDEAPPGTRESQGKKQLKLSKKPFLKRTNRTAPATAVTEVENRGAIPSARHKLPPLTPPNHIKMFEVKSAKRARFVKSTSLSFDKSESEQTDEERSHNLTSFPSDWKLLRPLEGQQDKFNGLQRANSNIDGFGRTFIVKSETTLLKNVESEHR